MAIDRLITDFLIRRTSAVWRVQGERFHLSDPSDRARDMISKMKLIAQGFTVIDLWGEDLLTRSDYVLEQAWRGREIDTYAMRNL